MSRAFLSLGSNMGESWSLLREAVSSLDSVVAVSPVYRTEPVGGPDQEPFLNIVIELDTDLSARELLGVCHRLESAANRVRTVRWGPRTLDLDLLFYDDVSIAGGELTVPHPRYTDRRFVLAPLEEVAPERCPKNWDATLPADAVHPRGALANLG